MQNTAPRRLWITGAASGLGLSLTGRALAEGHHVCATDVDLDKLEDAAQRAGFPRDRLLTLRLDVRDPDAFRSTADAVAARLSRLDVMINNAGVLAVGPGHLATDQDVHRLLDVNVKGVMFGSREAARLMLPQRAGHIINICSLSSLAPVPGMSVYCASKFAVRGFTLSLALELQPHGIAVTCVNPDGIATPMLRPYQHSDDTALVFSGPRILTSEEVSGTILGEVIEQRPLEIVLPASRGWLAKLGSAAPQLSSHAIKLMQWYGRRKQQRAQI
ncbi:MAG: short-chain dehydrogenase [Myxococcaceae bacterium]|nr:short-chain dehydrogenase [Myxococcaceae bacterium]